MASFASKMKKLLMLLAKEAKTMRTLSLLDLSQKTEDLSRNSRTIFMSKIFLSAWMIIKSNNFLNHMVPSNLYISRRTILVSLDSFATMILTMLIKITVQNVLRKQLMNSTTCS